MRKVTLFCLDHFVTLLISAYKYAVFRLALRLKQADDIYISSPKERFPKGLESFRGSLLVGGFTRINSRGIACFWRQSFSPKRQGEAGSDSFAAQTDVTRGQETHGKANARRASSKCTSLSDTNYTWRIALAQLAITFN